MAERRGGFRPTAPQNNPANINPMGGDGQSGRQPARYIPGLPYGEGQATMDQQTAAPMAAQPRPRVTEVDMPVGLFEPTTRPNDPITDGINMLPPNVGGVFNRQPTIPSILQKVSQYDPTGEVELMYARLSDFGY